MNLGDDGARAVAEALKTNTHLVTLKSVAEKRGRGREKREKRGSNQRTVYASNRRDDGQESEGEERNGHSAPSDPRATAETSYSETAQQPTKKRTKEKETETVRDCRLLKAGTQERKAAALKRIWAAVIRLQNKASVDLTSSSTDGHSWQKRRLKGSPRPGIACGPQLLRSACRRGSNASLGRSFS